MRPWPPWLAASPSEFGARPPEGLRCPPPLVVRSRIPATRSLWKKLLMPRKNNCNNFNSRPNYSFMAGSGMSNFLQSLRRTPQSLRHQLYTPVVEGKPASATYAVAEAGWVEGDKLGAPPQGLGLSKPCFLSSPACTPPKAGFGGVKAKKGTTIF